MADRIIHVIGTGTIGEPLIGLLADHKQALGLDDLTFHKRTPLPYERAKVNDLVARGARLVADPEKAPAFEALGHSPVMGAEEAIRRATVVIDCTPSGNDNKEAIYRHVDGPTAFLAQGSEKGFGKPYALGINDSALEPGDRFIQVVSCNSHNISALVKTIGFDGDVPIIENGRFLCMRRANDISQDGSFIPAPQVGKHSDGVFGTHHARDVHDLFATMGHDLRLWSSEVKLNTQYMHAMWFSLELSREMSTEEAVSRLAANPRISMTLRRSANSVFSFGRDHGHYGRILNQTVVARETVVSRGREVCGFCFTPQDGNALLSSVGAAMWAMTGLAPEDGVRCLRRYLFEEV